MLSSTTFLIKEPLSYFSSYRFLMLESETASRREIISASASSPSTKVIYSRLVPLVKGR